MLLFFLIKGDLKITQITGDFFSIRSSENIQIGFFFFFWLHWVFVAACGLSLVAASGLLTAVTSLVAEHGLQAHGLSSCGTQA